MTMVKETQIMKINPKSLFLDCRACLHAFDGKERKPRCMPCGLPLCARCFSDNLRVKGPADTRTVFQCPLCPVEHEATAVKDYPMGNFLEIVLRELEIGVAIPKGATEPSSVPLLGLTKKMASMRQELVTSMAKLVQTSQGISFQLLPYRILLKLREEEHLQTAKALSKIMQEHEEMAKYIRKECDIVLAAIQEEGVERQGMKVVEKSLLAAKSNNEILPAIDEATQCFDRLEDWTNETQESFPNAELLANTFKLMDITEPILAVQSLIEETTETTPADISGIDSQSEDTAASSDDSAIASDFFFSRSSLESSSPQLMPTIKEKIKRALEHCQSFEGMPQINLKAIKEMSIQTVLDKPEVKLINKETQTEEDSPVPAQILRLTPLVNLKRKSQLIIEGMEAGKVFAMRELEGQKRYAKISLQQNYLHLHVLSHQSPPSDAFILHHSDVMTLLNPSHRRVFLIIGTDQSTLGAILIKLLPNSERADNFMTLCTGPKGPSYLHCRFIDVAEKGLAGENICCGDFEVDNGTKAQEQDVTGEEDEYASEHECFAGSVFAMDDPTAEMFCIFTKHSPGYVAQGYFGKVKSGLDIIKSAISNYPKISEVKIIDCGIEIPF